MKMKPAFMQTYKVEIIHQQQTETTKIIFNSSLSRKNTVWRMRTGPTQEGTAMEGNLRRALSRPGEVHILYSITGDKHAERIFSGLDMPSPKQYTQLHKIC